MAELVISGSKYTAKELKRILYTEFTKDEDALARFYPAHSLSKYGFEPHRCSKCNAVFYRAKDATPLGADGAEICGDSDCMGSYGFIRPGGAPVPAPADGSDSWTLESVWDSFRGTFEDRLSSGIKHTAIKRYPVVARWRSDVDFVAAGIFCFQPFCVSGEVPPPANPLICAQPCLRFNDLDSVGLTGRHYSCFHMVGIQVFNYPNKQIQGRDLYFKEEVVDHNLDWLLNTLKIDPARITLKPDVWAGGGNLGACMEYFIDGLEIGNMVFMQYLVCPNTTNDTTTLRELDVRVIDTGIGLERIPWLLNGTVTSYFGTFGESRRLLQRAAGIDDEVLTGGIWPKFAPFSGLLNADENDMTSSWRQIAEICGCTVDEARSQIELARDLYAALDHSRTVLIAVQDGCLPSNTGGGSNIRLVLRAAFSIIARHAWGGESPADQLKLFMNVCDAHRADLEKLHGAGAFEEGASFRDIIAIEHARWLATASKAKATVEGYLRKKPADYQMVDEDWIQLVTSDGVAAEDVARYGSTPKRPITVPDDLNNIIAAHKERQQNTARGNGATNPFAAWELPADETDTAPTYAPWRQLATKGFDAQIVAIAPEIAGYPARTCVVLDRTALYATGGGQENDEGVLVVRGGAYRVVDVIKAPKHVIHVLETPLADDVVVGDAVTGTVDGARRQQLMQHHSAAHVLSAACRKVLGPHVWQAGAKKTVTQAHLDITHYDSIDGATIRAIEGAANEIVAECFPVTFENVPKDLAEKDHGFTLYQGGVVPGASVRVVQINDHACHAAPVDAEACCGTHVASTGEIGAIRIIRASRISDGVLRIEFVAGRAAQAFTNVQAAIIDDLGREWGVDLKDFQATASRFFTEAKTYKARAQALAKELLMEQVRGVAGGETVCAVITSTADQKDAGAALQSAAADVRAAAKSVCMLGAGYLLAVIPGAAVAGVAAALEGADRKTVVSVIPKAEKNGSYAMQIKVGKKKVVVEDSAYIQIYTQDSQAIEKVKTALAANGFAF